MDNFGNIMMEYDASDHDLSIGMLHYALSPQKKIFVREPNL